MVHFLKHSMKRKFHWEFLIFISSLMLLGTVQGRGQAVVLRGDTLMMDGDSLVHLVVPSYRGVLHWQESEQGVTWQDLEEEKGDTLTIRADREALYRGVVSEGSCEPLFTNTARVIHFPPEVMTGKVSDVGREEATVAGEVTADGGKPVTERGICYSLSHSPILFDHKEAAGSGTGTFTATLTGLTPDTVWYARAYAINVKGTAYGAEISFRTLPEADPETVTDIDGNTYPVVRVGNQLWMAENLRVTRAPDGQPVISYAYVGDPEREALYGRYYSWDAAMNGSRKESAQGICPDGWHLPSDEEVKQMEIALGMSRSEADIKNAWRGYGTGTKIKMGGSSGLEIPMAGMRHVNGSIIYNNDWAFLYTSSESGSYAWRRCFREASTGVGRFDTYPKTYGFSVRCIKDH